MDDGVKMKSLRKHLRSQKRNLHKKWMNIGVDGWKIMFLFRMMLNLGDGFIFF